MRLLKKYGVIWIALAFALLFDPGFQCPDDATGASCPISFMPAAHAQFTDVCPPEGCPEILIFQPTATVTYEWPNGQYYHIEFDPDATYVWFRGQPYLTYTPTLTAGEMQDPPPTPGGNPDPDGLYRKYSTAITRIIRQLDLIGELAFYTPIELVHIGDILTGLHNLEQLDGGSGDNLIPGLEHTIRPGQFPSMSAYILAKIGLLDADLQVIDAALRVEEAGIHPDDVMELRNSISVAGDIARNNRSMAGEILSTNDLMWGFITAPLEILDGMVQLENTNMNLPPGFGIFDAIEQDRNALLQRADYINAARMQFSQRVADYVNNQAPGGNEWGPCFPIIWYLYFEGWSVIDDLDEIAQGVTQWIISDAAMESNFALRYANWQLNDQNADNKASIQEMFNYINGLKHEVNESGAQCIESYQPIPDSGFDQQGAWGTSFDIA